MKLAPMVMLLIIIQITIMFFNSAYAEGSYTLNPYNISDIVNNTSPSVFEFILDPTGWSGSDILILISGIVGVAGAFAVGVYLVTKSDTILFMPIAMMFFGLGAIPMISLYNVFMSNSSMFGCTGIPCPLAIMVYGASVGLISIFYILAVLEFWSGRSTS